MSESTTNTGKALGVRAVCARHALSRGLVLRAMHEGTLRAIRTGTGRTSRFLTFERWVDTWLEQEATVVASPSATRSVVDLLA